jgi:hypothetical protein
MSNDVNIASSTVVALQGNAVVPGINDPTMDGYVLSWDGADGYYKLQPQQWKFTQSGTWTCPKNVYYVSLLGCSGGGSGPNRTNATSSGGIAGGNNVSAYSINYVSVTPGNNYTITIGAGGINPGTSGASNVTGNPTIFAGTTGSVSISISLPTTAAGGSYGSLQYSNHGYFTSLPSFSSLANVGYPSGIYGANNIGSGGGSGEGGYFGPGANGGDGASVAGPGQNGFNAPDNSGAGGGGGGGSSADGQPFSIGGNGGSGYLVISLP